MGRIHRRFLPARTHPGTNMTMATPINAQMSMPGMENSVGFLSSGTSIQPKTTSESESMIHKSFGNWTFMFHANVFVVDTQQSGPRGRDKFYSVNWVMPMLMRQ